MNAFAVPMPASDWFLFLITLVLFLFGMWLIVGEVRSWLNRRADLYRTPPSGIIKVLGSIYGALVTNAGKTPGYNLKFSVRNVTLTKGTKPDFGYETADSGPMGTIVLPGMRVRPMA